MKSKEIRSIFDEVSKDISVIEDIRNDTKRLLTSLGFSVHKDICIIASRNGGIQIDFRLGTMSCNGKFVKTHEDVEEAVDMLIEALAERRKIVAHSRENHGVMRSFLTVFNNRRMS